MDDAIVVGGGILGQSTAYHLVSRGAETLLVDREDPGRATAAGAGIISPPTNERTASAWNDFAVEAERYYPRLVERLRAEQDGDIGYDRCGKLTVVPSGDEVEPFRNALEGVYEQRNRLGHPSPETLREMTDAEARELVPPLGPIREALYYEDAARMDGRTFTRALHAASSAKGLRTRRGSVDRIRTGDRAPTVVVDGEGIDASNVVLATGAWSGAFEDQLGIRIPVAPRRGQIVHLDVDDASTGDWPVVHAYRGHYVVPWPDGRVAVGATHEDGVGFEPDLTVDGIHRVLGSALRLVPDFSSARIEDMRVGLRPVTPDELPIVGPVPSRDDVYLATGHGGYGLQLGPYTGKVLADLILDGETRTDADLAAFDVSRFQ